MSEKVGYSYIALGTIIIIAVAINIIMVLSGRAEPIALFKPGDISIDISSFMPTYELPNVPLLKSKVQQPTPEPLSFDALNKSMNLIIHLIAAGFLVNVGFKIASIGTQMTRPIVVKVKKTEQVINRPHHQPS